MPTGQERFSVTTQRNTIRSSRIGLLARRFRRLPLQRVPRPSPTRSSSGTHRGLLPTYSGGTAPDFHRTSLFRPYGHPRGNCRLTVNTSHGLTSPVNRKSSDAASLNRPCRRKNIWRATIASIRLCASRSHEGKDSGNFDRTNTKRNGTAETARFVYGQDRIDRYKFKRTPEYVIK